MSIVKSTTPAPDLLQMDTAMLETPAAKRALQAGLLEAKREALKSAKLLAMWGRPLLIAVIAVSFLHLWDTIALIKPDWIADLKLPDGLYHITAGAFTLAIDASAFYCVAASGTAALALGQQGRRWGIGFFMLLTFLLNAAYVVRYAPELDGGIRSAVLPLLDVLFAGLLPAFIPVAIFSLEGAGQRVELARLRLLVECTALEELVKPPVVTVKQKPEKASQRFFGESEGELMGEVKGEAGELRSPGRPRYELPQLLAIIPAGETCKRSVMLQHLACGESTLDMLLAEGVAAGRLEKVGRGIYRAI